MQDPKKHKFIFQSEDLVHQMEALDEFTTRHRTITQRIEETYKIGNQMTEYLENQIILDHHFRGEQDLFEQEYPHLKPKAEKLLGYDTYFDCSPLTGSILTEQEQPELYARLMKVQEQITCDLGEQLAKHNVKIEQIQEDIDSNIDTAAASEGGEDSSEVADSVPVTIRTLNNELVVEEAQSKNSEEVEAVEPDAAVSEAEAASTTGSETKPPQKKQMEGQD